MHMTVSTALVAVKKTRTVITDTGVEHKPVGNGNWHRFTPIDHGAFATACGQRVFQPDTVIQKDLTELPGSEKENLCKACFRGIKVTDDGKADQTAVENEGTD